MPAAPPPAAPGARSGPDDPRPDSAPAPHPEPRPAPRSALRRWGPLGALVLAAALAWWAFGDALSFDALSRHREALTAWRDAHYALAAAAFMAAYVAVVAFSLPGAIWMTLAGGFLFGLWPGGPMIVISATLGAAAIFTAARTGLGDRLAARLDAAGGAFARIRRGIEANQISFLLLMRLVPAVPFFLANLAPAFLGVRTRTFVWTTFVGIIPGTLVYTWVGSGLGAVFDRGEAPDLGLIFEPQILGPLLGLCALAALPMVLKLIRREGRT